jgi:cytochrome c oxidase subunit 2
VPVGAKVTFVATSRDVTHGLYIGNTVVNMMMIPGQVGRFTYTFDRPGTYPILCHEYCGSGHHTMAGQVIVEPR